MVSARRSMVSARCRASLLAAFVAATVAALAVLVLAPMQAQGQSPRTLGFRPAAAVSAAPAAPAPAAAPVPAADPALATAAVPPPPPPPLPSPAPLPNPSTRVALVEVGRIQIPKTGVDQPIREGVEQMVIDAGPAHWPGTASPGGWGNVVLAGHRSSHTEPFLRNAELAPGDPIVLSDLTGTYTYRVTEVRVVPNTALWIVDQHPGRTLTIFTCHPIGSSAERLIVRAELASEPRPGA
jgi:sortase A